MSNEDLLELLEENIQSGNRQTTAVLLREFLTQVIGSFQNLDKKNAENGYVGIDEDGNAAVEYIKAAAPAGYYLSDDGSWKRRDLVTLFESYDDDGNIGVAETDLANNNIVSDTLNEAGDKLVAEYGGTFVNHVSATRRVRLYCGATTLFDSGALAIASLMSWTMKVTIIRVTADTARILVNFQYGSTVATSCEEKSGLTLTGSSALRLTGTAAGAGALTNDIVKKLHMVNVIKKAD